MDIKKALEPTGKAYRESDPVFHVALDDSGALMIYKNEGNKLIGPEMLSYVLGNDYLPYHDKKEIRPEKAGELWEFGRNLFFIIQQNQTLFLMSAFGTRSECSTRTDIIHNQDGWKRLRPVVEEEDIERVVIEGVKEMNDPQLM